MHQYFLVARLSVFDVGNHFLCFFNIPFTGGRMAQNPVPVTDSEDGLDNNICEITLEVKSIPSLSDSAKSAQPPFGSGFFPDLISTGTGWVLSGTLTLHLFCHPRFTVKFVQLNLFAVHFTHGGEIGLKMPPLAGIHQIKPIKLSVITTITITATLFPDGLNNLHIP